MADTLVSAVVETVLGILASATLQEIGGIWGLKDELNKLASTFVTIQLVLQDAEIKQRRNEAIQHWLRELKNVACDAENILDRMATEGLLRTLDSERGMHHKLKSFFSSRNQLIFRFEMAREVKSIRGKLDAIAEERLKFHLGEGVMENRFGVTLDSRQTGSLVNESEIFGRHKEKEMIVEKLVNVTLNQHDPCVYVIQGMGGLGKTTLAQMVYNDERAERHFERRIWVCVSDDFSIQSILKAMIESIDGSGCNISTLDPLQRRLQEILMGKRFLLVLDDVWNENHRMWDGLRDVLRCGSKGSVIMVTTRIEKVAMMMATIGIHHIEYLSEVDSWSLFRQRAFATGEGEENLVVIGKAIVKKCGGVPLAIKALGGLMRFKSLESEWSAVKESEIFQLPEDETGILPALRLSYDNLLPQMRQCFAYCCIFPKDQWMDENQLIELWMANGFLYNIGGQTDMKLTGHLIIKELAWRSFLQLDTLVYPGGHMLTQYKMHDLMHDLASSVMRYETFILEHGKVLKIPKTLRHLFFSRSWKVPDGKLKLPTIESLHSIIVPAENTQSLGQDFSAFLSKQRYVRALDMKYSTIEYLPTLVCKLVHLRYLAMSCRNIKKLPDSLTHLQNLQTLKLNNSTSLLELPKHLKVMRNLRFLDIEPAYSLLCTPPGLRELTRLRRLSVFIVGEDASHHIDQLRDLNLSGHLSIQGLDKVKNLKDAKSANLMSKKDLTSLTFSWKNGTINNSPQHFEEVLQGLQPHQNLKRICIDSYQGSIFPNWMSSNLALKELKEILLYSCRRCEYLPAFGQLMYLTSLLLDGLDSIEHLDADFHGQGECSFPVLTSLTLMNLPNLEEWTIYDSLESFPSLNHLTVQGCPKLTRLPKLQSPMDFHGHRECSFPVLTSLTIVDLPNLEEWVIDDPGKGCPSLEHLNLERCPKLTRLPKLQSLTDLTIWDCSDALLTSIMFLTSLTSLHLHGLPELQVFPEGFLQNHRPLKSLIISGLPAIRTLSNIQLDNLTALKSLGLRFCTSLELLPEGLKHLNSLERLEIIGCDCLKSFPATILESLPSLRSLSFMSCMNLVPLTGSLNRAPALQVLTFIHLPELEYLPNCLWGLDSLSVISIQFCDKLRSLPDGFNNLKSLRRLEIRECPQLEKRCKKPMGEDWPKISDIPCIKINGEVIYTTLG